MANTFSQSATIGLSANSIFTTEKLTVADLNARAGALQNAMYTGTQVQVKLPDGSQVAMIIDAERSIPGINGAKGTIVLRAVGP